MGYLLGDKLPLQLALSVRRLYVTFGMFFAKRKSLHGALAYYGKYDNQ